jgi:hypothetical protein
MSEEAARKYALEAFDICCENVCYDDGGIRSCTCRAEFKLPAQAPQNAESITVSLDYH